MSAVISISTGKTYGVSRVCRAWGLSHASVYRDVQPARPEPPVRRRPGPQGPMSDAGLVEHIKQVITDSPFHGEGHRKVWAAKSLLSFVRSPEGNGCAERFIRTLKENLLWVRTFTSMDELQAALQKFKDKYNEHWLIQRHGHRSPNQFRRSAMDKIPAAA